jgi:AcrR family transcriptional regulator
MAPKLKPETLEERKAQILKAALTCFARKGYHQTTMDDIVQEAGLSKGGVYWHFSSKKELFLELFESIVSDVGNLMSAALTLDASATDKLRSALDMFVTFSTAEEFQDLFPLMIDVWAQNSQDPDVNKVVTAVYNHFRQPLVQLIEEGIASGEFKAVDAGALASILFALYDGLAVQWMIDATMVDWDAVSETVTQTFVAGLLVSEPQ